MTLQSEYNLTIGFSKLLYNTDKNISVSKKYDARWEHFIFMLAAMFTPYITEINLSLWSKSFPFFSPRIHLCTTLHKKIKPFKQVPRIVGLNLNLLPWEACNMGLKQHTHIRYSLFHDIKQNLVFSVHDATIKTTHHILRIVCLMTLNNILLFLYITLQLHFCFCKLCRFALPTVLLITIYRTAIWIKSYFNKFP